MVPLWESLQQEVIGVHAYWINYCQLFAGSRERLELLNATASLFFYIVQDVLLSDIQIGLSKLGDPAGSGSRENATLERLLREVEAVAPSSLRDILETKLTEYCSRCKYIRLRRNKELAHADLGALLIKMGHVQGPSLPSPSRGEIEEALKTLSEFMNAIEEHFTGSPTAYEHFVPGEDGDAMVWILKQGLRYDELWRNRVIAWDDMRRFDQFEA
jgi:hypothetical protein